MKYRVRVGKAFPCYVTEESTSPAVIVNVTHQAQLGERQDKKRLSTLLVAGLIIIFGTTVPATVYGLATGDFAPLKSIAGSTRELLEFGMKMLK
jgi:hypothetical protein